jgi:RHS repeat-associated protein
MAVLAVLSGIEALPQLGVSASAPPASDVAALTPSFPPPQSAPSTPSIHIPAPSGGSRATLTATAPQPAPTPSVAGERWTPFSHITPNADGTVTADLHVVATYRHAAGGWTRVDPQVKSHGGTSQPFSAENALRPIRFGSSSSRLVELALDGGPVTLSAPGLASSDPTQSGNDVKYGGVATDTALDYSVSPAGIQEQLVLASAAAPTSFSFHLADPFGQLGTMTRTSDGGYVFSGVIDGQAQLKLQPANAFEQASVPPFQSAVVNPGSAHLTVTRAGNGFDIAESVDASWMKDKTYPIVLDPAFTFQQGNGATHYAIAAFDARSNACAGGCPSVDAGYDLGVGWYTPFLARESYLAFDLTAAGIPPLSQVSSANFVPSVVACWEDTAANYHCNQNSYTAAFSAMNASWNAGESWQALRDKTKPSPSGAPYSAPFTTATQAAFNDPYPSSYIDWTVPFPVATVQGWLNSPGSNFGFGAAAISASPCALSSNVCGGPVWENNTPGGSCGPPNNCTTAGHDPQLIVNYDPAPTAPGTPTAVAGDASASVSWGAAGTNGGAFIDHYTVKAYSGATYTGLSAWACGPCTSATVPGLTNGTTYTFTVTATNHTGNGIAGPESAQSNPVTPMARPAVAKVLCGFPDPTCASPASYLVPGQAATFHVKVWDPQPSAPATVTTVTDTLPPGLALASPTLAGITTAVNGAAAVACGTACSVVGRVLTYTTNLSMPPSSQASPALDLAYVVVATDAGQGCAVEQNAVVAANAAVSALSSVNLPVCEGGLGYETYWSYVNRALGNGGKASVNMANGNLVVQQDDSIPIQAHGRLAFVLRRTYNSQDTAIASLPGSMGAGWQLNVSQTDDVLGSGIGGGALYVPVPASGKVTDLNPLAVTLVDRDGTRHVYQPNLALGTPIEVQSLAGGVRVSGALATLAPRALALGAPAPGFAADHICVDQTFTPPAGVHMNLWRYIAVLSDGTHPCGPAAPGGGITTTSSVIGYGTETPDRMRYEFTVDGHIIDMADGAGNELKYAYAQSPYAGVTGFGAPTSITEPSSQRQYTFTATQNGAGDVIAYAVKDPAQETTTYKLSWTTVGVLKYSHLYEVDNPDGGVLKYFYGSECDGSGMLGSATGAGINQMCGATDARGNTTYFTYTNRSAEGVVYPSVPTLPIALNRVASITDRRESGTAYGQRHNTTTFSYTASATPAYATADQAGHEQRFSGIDGSGRVAEVDEGTAGNSNYSKVTLTTWDGNVDFQTNRVTYCRQPDVAVDNNACHVVRRALNDAETGQHNGITTQDQNVSYAYGDEGQLLATHQCLGAALTNPTALPPCSSTLDTTSGYHEEYFTVSGTVSQYDDTPMGYSGAVGYGTVTSTPGGGSRSSLTTIFYVLDQTHAVRPSGNVSGATVANFDTVSTPDNNASSSPNATQAGVVCPSSGVITGNSGLVCKTVAGQIATTKYSFNPDGSRATMTTPKANAEGGGSYAYTYFSDSTQDLSKQTSAGGWLRTVTDPTGSFVAYGYDAAGHIARTWDRNATTAGTQASYPGTWANASVQYPQDTGPAPGAFTETVYGPASSAALGAPWRFLLSSKDQLGNRTGYTVDRHGNRTAIRPPRGSAAGNASFDTLQAFDGNDQLTSTLLPMETAANQATTYAWDAFGNRTQMTNPLGKITTYQYDPGNRLVATNWTRGAMPAPPYPAGCANSSGYGSPFAAGLLLCTERSSYDGVDNKVSSTDANGQVTSSAYDSVRRTTTTIGPRQVNGAGTTTQTIYDADGNALWVCSPREFAEAGGSQCSGPGPYRYATHHTYDSLDRMVTTTTYRESAPVAQGGSFGGSQGWSSAAFFGTRATLSADVNGDGKADLIAVSDTATYVMLSTGGSFGAPQPWSTTAFYGTRATIAADVNGDGKADLIAVSDTATYVMLSTGSAFGAPQPWSTTAFYGTRATITADLDGDHKADLIAVNDASAYVMLSSGTSYGAAALWSTAAFYGGRATVAGDINGDGRADLIAVSDTYTYVMLSSGSGFGTPQQWSTATFYGTRANLAADVNGDGQVDLVAVNDTSAYVMLSTGTSFGPTPQAWSSVPFYGTRATLAGDANGDARSDLIAVSDATAFVMLALLPASPAPTANTTSFGYDADGNQVTRIDPLGPATTTTTYNVLDRKTQQVVPTSGGSNTTTWTFDPVGNTKSVQRPDTTGARITAYLYDAASRLTDTLQGAGSADASAGVVFADGGSNARTRLVYDADGHVVARLDPRAFANANPATQVSDSSFMVRTDFDADGRPTSQWVPRQGPAAPDPGLNSSTQGNQCTTSNRPAAIAGVPSYPGGVGVCVTRAAYDAAGNRTQLTLPTSNGSDGRVVTTAYSDDNLVSTVTAPNAASPGSSEVVQTTVYDGRGKPVKQTDALGLQTVTSYNPDETVAQVTNQPNGSVSHVTTTQYDANGNVVRATDGSGNVTTTAYTADNRVAWVQDGAGDRTSYGYDANGNQTTVTSPSANARDLSNPCGASTTNSYSVDNLLLTTTVPFQCSPRSSYVTTYTYDPGSRKASQSVKRVDANGATILSGGTQSFTYYKDDRLQTETGRGGETISRQYDPAGNVALITWPGGSTATSYYLDGSTRSVDELARAGDVHQITSYAYDGLGSIAARSQAPAGGSAYLTQYSYGDAELPTSLSWSGVPATTWTYDAGGRPQTETDGNGQRQTWSFNPDNTLASLTLAASAGAATLSSWAYTYNGNYQQTGQQVGPSGVANPETYCYGYDGANRLVQFIKSTAGSNCPVPLQTAPTLSWDHNGNRLSYVPTTGPSTTAAYNADNSIACSRPGTTPITSCSAGSPLPSTSSYDGAGNMISDACAAITYQYDGFGRLTRATPCGSSTTTTYAYDGLDRRVQQAASANTDIRYDGQTATVIAESTGTTQTAYELSARGAHLAVATNAPSLEYLATDGQGNVTNTMNSAAAVQCRVRYDPFGTPVGGQNTTPCATGSTASDMFYRDGRRDSSTGQYALGSRVYDPAKATFLTPDSYRAADASANPSVGRDPLTANTYSYVNGDPVNLVDPNGHEPQSSFRSSSDMCYGPHATPASCRQIETDAVAWAKVHPPSFFLPPVRLFDVCHAGINSGPSCQWQKTGANPRDRFAWNQNVLMLQAQAGMTGLEFDCTAGCSTLKPVPDTPAWQQMLGDLLGMSDPADAKRAHQQQLASLLTNEARLEALSPHAQETVRALREWAKSNGWSQDPNSNVETWGEPDKGKEFAWRIKIKLTPDFRPGLAAGSGQPRFDVRFGDGDYVNPFTWESGRAAGEHIPLEDPYGIGPPPVEVP